MPKIQIIYGSTRQGRGGDSVLNWISNLASKRNDMQSEVIDLRNYPLPFFNESVSPSMNNGNYASKEAAIWADKVGQADGYIIVTPEYNRGYPAVLKNALDYVYKEWNYKPLAIVSYGVSSGGSRAAEQLKTVAIELKMIPIRESVVMPFYFQQFSEDGSILNDGYNKSAEKMLDELVKLTDMTKTISDNQVKHPIRQTITPLQKASN